MHVVVSWDISAQQPRWGRIDAALQNEVAAFPNYRPLNTVYAVTVADDYQRQLLADALIRVAGAAPEQVKVLVSPLMRGQYTGRLPPASWAPLNDVAS